MLWQSYNARLLLVCIGNRPYQSEESILLSWFINSMSHAYRNSLQSMPQNTAYQLIFKNTRFAFHWDGRGIHECAFLLKIGPIDDHVGWRDLFRNFIQQKNILQNLVKNLVESLWEPEGCKLFPVEAILNYNCSRTHQWIDAVIQQAILSSSSHTVGKRTKMEQKFQVFKGNISQVWHTNSSD